MCARSMHVAVGELGKAFAQASGHEIEFDFGTVGALQSKLDAGETADVIVLSVPGIATSDPAVGGSAGVHLGNAFEQAGWAAMMTPKAMPQQTGAEVAKRVVEGKAEFGLTLSGEVASVPGAVIVGPLPAPFGQDTIYCAAVMAASAAKEAAAAFIAALTHADTAATW